MVCCMGLASVYSDHGKAADIQRQEDEKRKQIAEERRKLEEDIRAKHADRVDSLKRTVTGSLEKASVDARMEGWTELLQLQLLEGDVRSLDGELLDVIWGKYDADKSGFLEKEEVKLVLLEFAR